MNSLRKESAGELNFSFSPTFRLGSPSGTNKLLATRPLATILMVSHSATAKSRDKYCESESLDIVRFSIIGQFKNH